MNTNNIVGTWTIISMKATNTKGDVIAPFGENPVGKIIYTSDGDMAVVYMRPDRQKFASDDLAGCTSEEIEQAFEGFDAYCGTYEVDADKGVVTHYVEASRYPNWEGSTQIRYLAFFDDQVQLSTTPIAALGDEWIMDLRWRRKT
ncbi:MAG: lipocalin-like domain-containing protein [Chloroflexota bacterium]